MPATTFLSKVTTIATAWLQSIDDHVFSSGTKHPAADIVNTPAGTLAATDVQTALNELDAEKALLAGDAAQDFDGKIITAADHFIGDLTGNVTGNADTATTATTANTLNSGEVTVTAHATTGDIFAAAANSILWDDSGGAITTTIFPDAPKAGMVRDGRCNGASKFTAGANLEIVGVPSGSTITLADKAQFTVRAITTTLFRMTYRVSGTFTLSTWNGWATPPAPTFSYKVENGIVHLHIPAASITGTSNSTTANASTLPDQVKVIGGIATLQFSSGLDNTANVQVLTVVNTVTLWFYKEAAGGTWTASGTKRVDATDLVYSQF